MELEGFFWYEIANKRQRREELYHNGNIVFFANTLESLAHAAIQ